MSLSVIYVKRNKIKFMLKEIKVTNCMECPFATNDNEFGFCSCNISDEVSKSLEPWSQLPENTIHDLCPLKSDVLCL